jgi:hypothetical protein
VEKGMAAIAEARRVTKKMRRRRCGRVSLYVRWEVGGGGRGGATRETRRGEWRRRSQRRERIKRMSGGRGEDRNQEERSFSSNLLDHIFHVSSDGAREEDWRHDTIVDDPALELTLPMSMTRRVIKGDNRKVKDHFRERLNSDKIKCFCS